MTTATMGFDQTRRRILRIHGSGLLILGLANAVLSTLGWLRDVGPMAFLNDDRLGHVGLIQAYLLAALFGVVLIVGSRQPAPVTWNRIGILVHLAILSAYAFHWNYFGEVPGGDILRNGIFLHLGAIAVEAFAVLGGRQATRRVSETRAPERAPGEG